MAKGIKGIIPGDRAIYKLLSEAARYKNIDRSYPITLREQIQQYETRTGKRFKWKK